MRPFGKLSRRFALVAFALGPACGGVDGVLANAEVAYEQARYEDSMVWLHEVEPEIHARSDETRARFHYLRGMTSFRLDEPIQARYHLALAQEIAGANHERVLGLSWMQRLRRTLSLLQEGRTNPAETGNSSEVPDSSDG